jgi:hypothetical protein
VRNESAPRPGIVGSSVGIHKWKTLNAFKTRETMLAGAGQGELQAVRRHCSRSTIVPLGYPRIFFRPASSLSPKVPG